MRYAYIDCDRTLIYSHTEFPHYQDSGLPVRYINGRKFYLNSYLIDEIKDFKAMGHGVVVWSAGGPNWAWKVAEVCDITKDIIACLGKPDFLFDDKQPDRWMPSAQDLDPLTRFKDTR